MREQNDIFSAFFACLINGFLNQLGHFVGMQIIKHIVILVVEGITLLLHRLGREDTDVRHAAVSIAANDVRGIKRCCGSGIEEISAGYGGFQLRDELFHPCPSIVELMIADSHSIVVYLPHDIDDIAAFGQRSDNTSLEVIAAADNSHPGGIRRPDSISQAG